MIWTEEENDIRELDNMFNRNGRTCKSCKWCNWEKGQEFFTCGHHLQNFTPDSYCAYWTSPKDPKLVKYYKNKKAELLIRLKSKK